MWNLSIPTRLKAWIDSITVAGKTFKYTETGSVGLVNNKKVLHIQANGGIYNGFRSCKPIRKNNFYLLEVSNFQQLFIEGMDYNPDKTDTIVSEAIERAKEIANVF